MKTFTTCKNNGFAYKMFGKPVSVTITNGYAVDVQTTETRYFFNGYAVPKKVLKWIKNNPDKVTIRDFRKKEA